MFLFLGNPDHLAGEHALTAKVGNLQVRPHGFGQHANQGGLKVRLRRQALRAGGSRRVAVAAPEVQFIRELRADGIGSQAEPVRQGETEVAERIGVQAQFIQLCTDTCIGGRIEIDAANGRLNRRYQGGRIGDARPRPRLLHPGDCHREIEVGIEDRFDDLIEYRVVE